MPHPSEVNPRNFQVKEIVYSLNTFSIAWGVWENGDMRLAMRWDGEDESDMGYPKTFGNPVWFLLPGELTFPFLSVIDQMNPSARKASLFGTTTDKKSDEEP